MLSPTLGTCWSWGFRYVRSQKISMGTFPAPVGTDPVNHVAVGSQSGATRQEQEEVPRIHR